MYYCPNCLDELVEVEVEPSQHRNLVCPKCIKLTCFHKAFSKKQVVKAIRRRMEARRN